MKPWIVATAVLAATMCAGVLAQTTETPVVITLDEALRRALEASHRLAEAAARNDAALAVADQRHAAVLPQVGVQAGYTRTNHVQVFGVPLPNNQLRVIYPDVPDNAQARLDLRWPIYTAGRLSATERAARAEAAAVSSDRDALRADLELEVTRAYWALVTSLEAERVVEQSVSRIRAHLAAVRSQLDAGLVSPNDVLSVEAQESRQRMLQVQAGTHRETAAADLARLVGVAPGTAFSPAAAFDPPPPVDTLLDRLLQDARQQRPERAALVHRLQAARERLTAAAAGTKPTINVSAGLDYARPNPRIFPRLPVWQESWDAAVIVQWSLFDGGRVRAERAEAAAGVRAVEARAADFDGVLAVEIRQRLSELQASRAAIEAADDGVRAAAEARRVTTERFDAGVTTSTEVLDAQVALLQADLDRTQAIANARLAEARLVRALGASR